MNNSAENKTKNDFPRCPFLEDNENRVISKMQKINNVDNQENNNCNL
jgi:hypothetical protein